ncbi:MAG: hypothetical protein LC700_03965, partial [Actinobacteria bacterium]|nr:hypothetical protein [Actinomycetota bacterium]
EALWQELASARDTTSYNFYGPTECTVDALSCRVVEGMRPAVGRPLDNLRAYLLDDQLRPVPVGCICRWIRSFRLSGSGSCLVTPRRCWW